VPLPVGLISLTFVLSFFLLIPLMLYPSDTPGWLLCYAAILVFAAFKEIRRDFRLLAACIATFVAHATVAVVNAYHHTVTGADKDAIRFYKDAVIYVEENVRDWAMFDAAGQTYSQFLATIFRLTGTKSFFLAEVLSCLAISVAGVILVLTFPLIGDSARRATLLLMFGFLPASLILCSITIRESFQCLFTILLARAALQLRESPRLRKVLELCLYAIALGASHHGLTVFALFTVLVAITWAYGYRASQYRHLRRVTAVFLAAVIVIFALSGEKRTGALGTLQSGKLLQELGDFRERVPQADARTNYTVELNTNSFTGLALSLPAVIVFYLFAPFPWQVQTPGDLIACGEGILRGLLIFFTFLAWREAEGEKRKRILFLFSLFAVAETLWAIGTVNWGTAVRHHLPAYALILLTGGPRLIQAIERLCALLLRLPSNRATALPGINVVRSP